MIKKQLGLLAGAVALASGAQAAIDISAGDVLVVFNSVGNGSYYELVAGETADSLAAGGSFSLDIGNASAALGSIDNFAVFGVASAGADGTTPQSPFPSYNYTELTYVDVGGGLLFSGTTAPITNTQAINKIFAVETFLNTADLGLNGEGSLGDFDADANVADLLVSSVGASVVTLNAQRDVGAATAPLVLGTSQIVAGNLEVSPVPVPAAAWLFGSALLGLGVVRRK